MGVLVFVSALTTLIWTKDGRQGGGIGERWGRPDKNNDGREIERMGERDLLITSASVFRRAASQRLYRLISSPPFSQSHFQKRTSYIIKHSTWYFEENFLRHVSSKFCCKSSARQTPRMKSCHLTLPAGLTSTVNKKLTSTVNTENNGKIWCEISGLVWSRARYGQVLLKTDLVWQETDRGEADMSVLWNHPDSIQTTLHRIRLYIV